LAALGYLQVYVALEDAERIGEYIDEVEELINQTKYESLRQSTYWAWGKLHEIEGNYEAALESYDKLLEVAPTELMINRDIGRCYRKLTKYRQSLEHLNKALKKEPFDQKTNYEMALLYSDMREMDKAFHHLERATTMWQDADPEYKPAKKAKQTLAEWKQKSYL
jgi:tetratricopeptide (TPR) repeat protein